MDDIVSRLQQREHLAGWERMDAMRDAAEEIKRLRKEIAAMRRQALQNMINISENADMYNLH